MVNHRLLKAIITGQQAEKPQDEITVQLAERRRLNRMAERDVGDWLYARYLQPMAGTDTRFPAEIIDVTRGGLRVRLLDNGAVAFIPAPFIHAVRDEMVCSRKPAPCKSKVKRFTARATKLKCALPKYGWKRATWWPVQWFDVQNQYIVNYTLNNLSCRKTATE